MNRLELKRLINEEINSILKEDDVKPTRYELITEMYNTLKGIYEDVKVIDSRTGKNGDDIFNAWNVIDYKPFLSSSQLSKLKKLGWKGYGAVNSGGEAGWYGGTTRGYFNLFIQFNYNQKENRSYFYFCLNYGKPSTYNGKVYAKTSKYYNGLPTIQDLITQIKVYERTIKSYAIDRTFIHWIISSLEPISNKKTQDYHPGSTVSWGNTYYTDSVTNIKDVDKIFGVSQGEIEKMFNPKEFAFDWKQGL